MNCESYQTDNGNMQISYFDCDKKQNKKSDFRLSLRNQEKFENTE